MKNITSISRILPRAAICRLKFGLLACVAVATPAQGSSPAVLWHALDGKPAVLLRQLIVEFNATHSDTIREETGMDLIPALLTQTETNTQPDAVLAPSDVLGVAELVKASIVPALMIPASVGAEVRSTVVTKGVAWGVPVLDGNTLLLFYNKRLLGGRASAGFAVPPQLLSYFSKQFMSLTSKDSRDLPVAWKFDEPYLFLAFASSFGVRPAGESIELGSSEMTRALSEYRKLGERLPALAKCAYDCAAERFYKGEFSAVINGEWALDDAVHALGADLGVAPLPGYGGSSMHSLRATHVLFFPGQALSGPHGQALKEFAAFLSDIKTQRRWRTFAKRLPVHKQVQEEMFRSKDPIEHALIQALRESYMTPSSARIQVLWQALGKGLHLMVNGSLSVEESQKYMVRLSQVKDFK